MFTSPQEPEDNKPQAFQGERYDYQPRAGRDSNRQNAANKLADFFIHTHCSSFWYPMKSPTPMSPFGHVCALYSLGAKGISL
jgi:hypothetical protein